jgi:hypothetical protein
LDTLADVDGNRILARRAGALEAEVDGQRVLMSPTDFNYFGLVDTGALVWDRIDGETSLDDLVDGLAAHFDADIVEVRKDVVDFVSALDAAGFLAESPVSLTEK